MTDDQRDWQFLLDIFYELGRLDNPLYSVLASQEDRQKARQEARKNLLTRAICSGKVSLEGCREAAFGELERVERIEAKIDEETEINISLNEITLRKGYDIPANDKWPARKDRLEIARFKRVQADRAGVQQWLIKAGYVIDELMAAGDEASDDVEAECKTWLAALPEHTRLTKEKARKSFNEFRRKAKRKIIGVRPFNRAWKEAAPSSWHNRGCFRRT